MREHLPADRESVTHHFTILHATTDQATGVITIHRLPGYVTVSFYDETIEEGPMEPPHYLPDSVTKVRRIGEVFVKLGKAGDESAAVDQWAIAVSVALQHGADAEKLFRKFLGARYEPAGRVEWSEGSEQPVELAKCTSPTDYVARWVLARFYPEAK